MKDLDFNINEDSVHTDFQIVRDAIQSLEDRTTTTEVTVGEFDAINVGSAGIGVFKQKTGLICEFYKLNSTNGYLSIVLDGTDKIDFTVDVGSIPHSGLTGLGGDDHSIYHTDTRADTWFTGKDLVSLGTKEHHDLDGLGDDDHSIYHTDTRADTWFTGKDLADLGTKSHTDLDGMPSSSNADHDGRYYTETELDGGQLDNRYYTETEVDNLLGGGYLALDCSNDPLTATLASQHILPDGNSTYDLGDATDHWRTIYLSNEGGNVIDCQGVQSGGSSTNYIFDCGGGQWGGDLNQGGTFTFKMADIATSLGTCVNQLILDPGRPDVFAAGTTNDIIFQAYNGVATYGFVSSFGGWNDLEYGLELRRVSGTESNGKTLIFDNQVPVSDFRRSIDFRINSVDKLTIENTGEVVVSDYITAPRADITAIQSGSGFGNAGVQAVGATAYLDFFGLGWFDYLTLNAQSTNLPVCLGLFPNGTSTASYMNVYNSSNTGATAWIEMGVNGSTAGFVVRDFSQSTNITTLRIGSGGNDYPTFDVTCSTLTSIDFVYAGVIECQVQPDTLVFNNGATDTQIDWGTNGELGLQVATNDIIRLTASQIQAIQDIVISDAQNIVVNTTTGTKIGTATSQKLAFYNSTPIIQPSSTGQTAGSTVGTGNNVNDDSTFTGGVGSTAYTIGDVVAHLKNLGLMAA